MRVASRGESAEKKSAPSAPDTGKAPVKIKLLGNGISKIKVKKDKPENGEPGEKRSSPDKKRKILTLSSKN